MLQTLQWLLRRVLLLPEPLTLEVNPSLLSTAQMLKAGFPNGITRESADYLPLLSVLRQGGCSFRCIAHLMQVSFGIDYSEALNDVYGFGNQLENSTEELNRIRDVLIPHGYFAWLNENDYRAKPAADNFA